MVMPAGILSVREDRMFPSVLPADPRCFPGRFSGKERVVVWTVDGMHPGGGDPGGAPRSAVRLLSLVWGKSKEGQVLAHRD